MTYDLEILRTEMISSFYEYAATPSVNMAARMAAWDNYCEKREIFIEQSCYRKGQKYVQLKHTLVEADDGRTYKKGPVS